MKKDTASGDVKKTLHYYNKKIREGFSRDKYFERAIIEYSYTYEEMGDLLLKKGKPKDLWRAFRCFKMVVDGPENIEIGSYQDYVGEFNDYFVIRDFFIKPNINNAKEKLVKLSNILEEVYEKEAWVQKPHWVTVGDFYYIVHISKEKPAVKKPLIIPLKNMHKPITKIIH